MNKEKHPFIFENSNKELNNTQQYSEGENTISGSDGSSINETYKLYLIKCDKFKTKAKKYRTENLWMKDSILHHNKCGYECSEQLEEEVLLKREKLMSYYKKAFDVASFKKEENFMYECFGGESKKIRVIRDLHQEWKADFSDDFDKKRACWFTRYCILSRFVEAARKIIFLNRLKKVLENFRIAPEILKLKNEIAGEEENSESENKKSLFRAKYCTYKLTDIKCPQEKQ